MPAAPQVLPHPQPLREGATEQQVYLLPPCGGLEAGPGPAAGVLPDSAAARELAAAAAPAMSFWRADRATGARTRLAVGHDQGLMLGYSAVTAGARLQLHLRSRPLRPLAHRCGSRIRQ